MHNRDVAGISVENLDKLMLDIINYAEKSRHITNDIEALVRESAEYFDTEEADLFRDRYERLLPEIDTINRNILIFKDDLLKLKSNYNAITNGGVDLVNEAQKQVSQMDYIKEEL